MALEARERGSQEMVARTQTASDRGWLEKKATYSQLFNDCVMHNINSYAEIVFSSMLSISLCNNTLFCLILAEFWIQYI